MKVSVSKANPVYTTPTNLTATYGQTLADVTLPEGFSWEDPATTPVGSAGSSTFKVTYTPADTGNYNVVTGIEVTITVSKAESQLNFTVSPSDLTYGESFTLSVTPAIKAANTLRTAASDTVTFTRAQYQRTKSWQR